MNQASSRIKDYSSKTSSKPLRILYLIDSLTSGGAQKQLVTLVSALDQTQIKPVIAVYHPLWYFRSELDKLHIPIHQLGTTGARNPSVLFRLVQLLRKQKFDIIHSYLRTPGILARIASMFCPGTKVIISERNIDLGHSLWSLFLERLLVHKNAIMIVNAEAIRANVIRLIPKWSTRIYVVSNGVTFIKPTAALLRQGGIFRKRFITDNNQVLIGVIGRITSQKDPHFLLDALERLPSLFFSRLRVVWVGAQIDTALANSLEKRLKHSVVRNWVTFLPEMQQIRVVYSAIDALLLPSRWEGLPNAVLEALAEQKPVIATNVGDVKRLVENGRTGWIIPSGDTIRLAQAIYDLVNSDPGYRKKMGVAGSMHVQNHYSCKKLVERTLRVYRIVMSQSSPF